MTKSSWTGTGGVIPAISKNTTATWIANYAQINVDDDCPQALPNFTITALFRRPRNSA